jgi:hypothetical protein
MTEENKKDKPEKLQKMADEIAEMCNEQQQYHSGKAQEFGYARDVFKQIKDNIAHIPYDEPLLNPAERSLVKFRKFIQEKQRIQELYTDVSSTAFTLGTSVAVTGSFIAPHEPLYKIYTSPKPPSFWTPDRNEKYATRLDKLDPELGKVYRSIWNSFFGGKDNPERTALYQMCQAYDHFFDILSPDEDVRKSPFFTKKSDNNPDRVHRKERLHYAANKKIKDESLRELLLEQDDYIIELYQRLNIAHKRSTLDRKKAKEILDAMCTMLEQWIDAIEL